jgi:hypothetical protein
MVVCMVVVRLGLPLDTSTYFMYFDCYKHANNNDIIHLELRRAVVMVGREVAYLA